MTDLSRLAARMDCIGFDGLTLPQSARELIDRGVSAVILFTRNYESPEQLRELCGQIKATPSHNRQILICIDQEGGRVQRLREPPEYFTIIPSMREIGRMNDVELARKAGNTLARELRAMNIDMDLAPVLDVDSNPANPVIVERSFGADPELVARMGCAMIEGLQSAPHQVAACGKHFPGHGDTSIDSHFDLPRLSHDLDRLNAVELVPFAAAIKAGVAAIMCSHVLYEPLDSQFPATMSRAVIDGILRKQFGFREAVLSDDLEMKAIIDHFGIEQAVMRGAQAGIDLFLICHTAELQHQAIDALVRAVESGELARDLLIESNRRLDRLFSKYVRPAQAVHSPA